MTDAARVAAAAPFAGVMVGKVASTGVVGVVVELEDALVAAAAPVITRLTGGTASANKGAVAPTRYAEAPSAGEELVMVIVDPLLE